MDMFVLYFVILIVYTFIYQSFDMSNFNGKSCDIVDSLYFSSTIMSTVGFGDMTPATKTLKLIVISQQIITTILIGMLITNTQISLI
jgi:voltage-gated potassium channel